MTKLYRHFKNKPYKLLGTVRHSETLEEMVLYETRYENELGKLWVRPAKMFYEDVEVQGQMRPRFQKENIEYHETPEVSDEMQILICHLLEKVFQGYDIRKFKYKLGRRTDIYLVTAWVDGKFIGFKLGYAISSDRFYSWLGAVDPDYHGVGIGRGLMQLQHSWCLQRGFKIVETKTTNQWPNMLILNIKNGFQVVGTQVNNSGKVKIIMEKYLEAKGPDLDNP